MYESAVPNSRTAGRILIVDDDYSIRRTLHLALYTQGFDVNEAAGAEEAAALVRALRYDAILLDINMPGRSGIELCAELRREHPAVAVLMLSVRDREEDRVEALDAGADDYIVKPFHIRELAARIRAVLRRSRAPRDAPGDTIKIGELSLQPDRRLLRKSGSLIHLTPKEFELLEYLMRHPGVPVTHARLLSTIWGPEYAGQVEYLRTFVRQLRKKLEDNPAAPRYLLTEAHVGYRFRDRFSESEEAHNRQS